MNIGLSLSGGGFRATVFHLGVLARLAEEGRLEEVASLSTVSGGSLCAGLVYARNGFRWPTGVEFAAKVVPEARKLLTSQDLQFGLMGRVLRMPSRIFDTRADDLSLLLQEHWGVTASLSALPERPRWIINATCYETGQNWRFERSRMGDDVFGHTDDTDIPLSDALAASAGFPGLIGPLEFDTRHRSWSQRVRGDGRQNGSEAADSHRWQTEPGKPAYSKLHLWDGGVYDNLGVESLHRLGRGWRKGNGFLIVSDGCSALRPERYRYWKAADRMIRGIMMDQIRTLRFRAVLERFKNHQGAGSILQIGTTCEGILREVGREDEISELRSQCLSHREAEAAAETPTDIRRLSPEHFERLFRHGFEVADYTLYAYHPDEFPFIGYRNSRYSCGAVAAKRRERALSLKPLSAGASRPLQWLRSPGA